MCPYFVSMVIINQTIKVLLVILLHSSDSKRVYPLGMVSEVEFTHFIVYLNIVFNMGTFSTGCTSCKMSLM